MKKMKETSTSGIFNIIYANGSYLILFPKKN